MGWDKNIVTFGMVKRFITRVMPLFLFVSVLYADQGGNDTYGHMWTDSNSPNTTISYNWIDASDGVSLFGPTINNDTASVDLPFNFNFYGETFNRIHISVNGFISFAEIDAVFQNGVNDNIPEGSGPDSLIAVFWDNLIGFGGGGNGVYYKTIGTAPHRQFIIEWDIDYPTETSTINFEAILYEHSNLIKFQYNTETGARYNSGGSATIGVKKNTLDGVEYSFNTAGTISDGMAILFHNKFVDGTDAQISPTAVQVGDIEIFKYVFDNIDTTPAGLGKLDRFAIGNPFSSYSSNYTKIIL